MLPLALLLLFAQPTPPSPPLPPPARLNWYWLNTYTTHPPNTGAAFLANSYYLRAANPVVTQPRVLPLKLPPNTYRMAVVRIDHYSAQFTQAQRAELARMIAEVPTLTHTTALQIDFDAPASAYPFYRALLTDLRRALPPHTFLSITALTSWCGKDSWMTNLPVDEIVPMFFRQGKPRREPPLDFPACKSSAGLSDDEPPVRLPASIKRVYTFKTRTP